MHQHLANAIVELQAMIAQHRETLDKEEAVILIYRAPTSDGNTINVSSAMNLNPFGTAHVSAAVSRLNMELWAKKFDFIDGVRMDFDGEE